jgi:ABC-type Na+ transport system ATPase subunit NatA
LTDESRRYSLAILPIHPRWAVEENAYVVGKTTTVRILTTLIRADAGRAEVAGFDVTRQPQRVRARIGVTGQSATMDELLR